MQRCPAAAQCLVSMVTPHKSVLTKMLLKKYTPQNVSTQTILSGFCRGGFTLRRSQRFTASILQFIISLPGKNR
jgi:hypothetical protein